jgi:hypothetical protein
MYRHHRFWPRSRPSQLPNPRQPNNLAKPLSGMLKAQSSRGFFTSVEGHIECLEHFFVCIRIKKTYLPDTSDGAIQRTDPAKLLGRPGG